MENNKPNNIEEVKQRYVETMLAVPTSSRNYCRLVAVQSRKLMDTLLGVGYSQTDAEAALYEAHRELSTGRALASLLVCQCAGYCAGVQCAKHLGKMSCGAPSVAGKSVCAECAA
jgi:hypothetical protein